MVVYTFRFISIKMHMHEQTTIGFGVYIWGRKYLNECTPSGYVSLCASRKVGPYVGRTKG